MKAVRYKGSTWIEKREVKFRGKLMLGKHRWVYGFYVRVNDSHVIIQGGVHSLLEYKRCDPSTIGQMTGYKDINDKDVWEGDIVKVTSVKEDTLWQEKFAQVAYDPDMAAFTLITKEHPNGSLLSTNHLNCCIEVVGNVYDNPELLNPELLEQREPNDARINLAES